MERMSPSSISKVSSRFRVQIFDHVSMLVDKETINRWHVGGSIKKAYDRSVKGYVYITD